ncbi:hypothetical protein BKA58DRAFT_137404 [Alternaria rosae]|uniref:uncharacterized protein n=1 Tax=Alternaria rosae TaxID=1187941 RepID=UPI001E8E5BBF|nr:uncharacterized protein BKA58DRAFT_73964 [Alternaria rosae]XP_046028176.1 uncharacterized protein BKA58DRAFT_137404 [Alternaria rosae]KAH6845913.1 hypothetical protein BKA58DRAFT_73964 [Alternaria rosae]KAH6876202.1 hypothetical protein BKA58DRAFT_137404 [Alternaria rosae]
MSATNEQPVETPVNKLNAKQQNRIQKRRLARQQLATHFALVRKNRQTHDFSQAPPNIYVCLRYPRGPDGRFLPRERVITKAIESLTIQETTEKSVGSLDGKPKTWMPWVLPTPSKTPKPSRL